MRARLVITALILILLWLGNPGAGFLCTYLLLLAGWIASEWKSGPKLRLTLGMLTLLLTAFLSYQVAQFSLRKGQPDYRGSMRQLAALAESGETAIIKEALKAYNQEIAMNGHGDPNTRHALWKMQDVIYANKKSQAPPESKTAE